MTGKKISERAVARRRRRGRPANERCHADDCGKEKLRGELFHSLFLVQFGREMQSGCPEQCQRGCVEGETFGRAESDQRFFPGADSGGRR